MDKRTKEQLFEAATSLHDYATEIERELTAPYGRFAVPINADNIREIFDDVALTAEHFASVAYDQPNEAKFNRTSEELEEFIDGLHQGFKDDIMPRIREFATNAFDAIDETIQIQRVKK